MKTMKYGFINTSGFNKGIKNISKDSNFADVKEKLQKAAKISIEILSNKH
jgi:hypothetical protein